LHTSLCARPDGAAWLASFLFVAAAAVAQQFESVRTNSPSAVSLRGWGTIEPRDFDGDGDLDLASGDQLLTNDGTGRFTVTSPAGWRGDARSAAGADLDGDGDCDLVQGCGNLIAVSLNQGGGTWATSTIPLAVAWIGMADNLALADADHDGDLDLFHWGPNWFFTTIHLNQGNGSFASAAIAAVSAPKNVVVDIDGDGDADMLQIQPWQFAVFVNNGAGLFTNETAARIPPLGFLPVALLAKDLDRDGDVDLFLSRPGNTVILRNDGSGVFTDASWTLPPNFPGTQNAATGDVDGDGFPELLLPTERLLFANVAGVFVASGTGPIALPPTSSFRFVDLDGDGREDLIAGNQPAPHLCFRAVGGYQLFAAEPFPIAGTSSGAAVGDLDGDGFVDLLFDGGQSFRNDGSGGFLTAIRWPFANGMSLLLCADFDGDGFGDALLGGYAGWQLLRGTASGPVDVTSTRLPSLAIPPAGATAADLDQDGDLDLLLVGDRLRLLLQGSGGVFTDVTSTRLPTPGFESSYPNPIKSAQAADLDGDGRLDIVATVEIGTATFVQVLRNGPGTVFTDVTAASWPGAPTAGYGTRLVLGDVDGDGDVDVIQSIPNGTSSTLQFLRNNGSGVLSDATAGYLPSTNGDYIRAIYQFDADRDGDLDLWLQGSFAATGNTYSRLLRNSGDGHHADVSTVTLGSIAPLEKLLVADLDHDGDVDVLGAPWDGWDVYRNTWLDLCLTSLPNLGQTFQYRLRCQPGQLAAPATGIVGIATTRLITPLVIPPFGELHLPANALLVPVAIPAPLGEATLSLTVPAAPSLFGMPLFAQCLFLAGSDLHLSRVTEARIL
jgi:hypothetical protein